MINPKRKIHSYNNPNKYWDETRNMSTIKIEWHKLVIIKENLGLSTNCTSVLIHVLKRVHVERLRSE